MVLLGFIALHANRRQDKLLEFFEWHLHSADDHYVRFKWDVGSIAFWDNRYAHHESPISSHLAVQTSQTALTTLEKETIILTHLSNRAVVHRVIPGTYEAPRRGIRTTVFGEKRKFKLPRR